MYIYIYTYAYTYLRTFIYICAYVYKKTVQQKRPIYMKRDQHRRTTYSLALMPRARQV